MPPSPGLPGRMSSATQCLGFLTGSTGGILTFLSCLAKVLGGELSFVVISWGSKQSTTNVSGPTAYTS